MSKDVLLCMKQVEKSFSGVQVLKKVDFEIKQGKFMR
jgi:ABC-type sugar transport system ATPase subunit